MPPKVKVPKAAKNTKNTKKPGRKVTTDEKVVSGTNPLQVGSSSRLAPAEDLDFPKVKFGPKSSADRPSKDNWALQAVKDEKARLEAGLPEDEDFGETALHHIVSKETLSNLVDAFKLSTTWSSPDGTEGREGARRFWAAVSFIAGDKIRDQADSNPHKLLWNLPINLELGPRKRVGDPGSALDPNTRPTGATRELDEPSQHLEAFNDLVDDYLSDDEKTGLSDGEWDTLTGHLVAAFNKGGEVPGQIPPPQTEQWVNDPVNNNFQRKGLKQFPGVDKGVETFGNARENREVLPAPNDAVYGSQEVPLENGSLTVEFDHTTITHILQRHTYEQFDPEQAKGINSFWPPGETFDSVQARVSDLLPGIADRAKQEILRTHPNEELAAIVEESITLQGQKVNGHTIFFIMKVTYDHDGSAIGHIETVAPDGANAHAYTKTQIQDIFDQL